MKTLSLRKRDPNPSELADRPRNQFRLWLTLQLRLRDPSLPKRPTWAQLREALRPHLGRRHG